MNVDIYILDTPTSMATLSATDLDVISQYPLADSLSDLRDALRASDKSFQEAEAADDDGDFTAPARPRLLLKVTDQLLVALKYHEAASEIKSESGLLDVYAELQAITTRIAREFTYQMFRPLARLVISKASDIEIWTAVLDLIASFSSITPPQSAPLSYDGTPIVRSTSSHQGSEQTRQILDVALKYELKGRVYRDVEGFFQKYFEDRPWSTKCKKIFAAAKTCHTNGRWTDFPDPPAQAEVWAWLTKLQDTYFPDATGRYYTTSSTKDLHKGEAKRQLDIFMKRRGIERSKHNWPEVLVIGEHKQSHHGVNELLLQLSRYMRDLFTSQPTRRFVHGFFLHATKMELWVFDRSGPYSSGEFDIHEEPEKFIQAIAGYAFMTEEELGLDTFVNRNRNRASITIQKDARGKKRKLQLDEEPFVKQRAVVCRGTTCFRTTDHAMVVKFSWTSDKRPPEAEHLEVAQMKCVQGVASFVGYQRITSIADLRDGLTFKRPWTFRGSAAIESTSTQSNVSHSLGLLQVSNTATNSQISGSGSGAARMVRTQSGQESLQAGSLDIKKRKSPDIDEATMKKSKTSSQVSKLHYGPQNGASTSLYEQSNDKYDNRIFGCLAISPAGRGLNEFGTIQELLTAMRDAIKAHQSLYLTGQILHRDISENNIIITDPKKAHNFTGMLIDLDLAKKTGSGRTGARHQTGTMEFMAIEVLRRVAHTYRHDLESFFYVLLWICGRRVWERGFQCDRSKRPERDVFKRWNHGSFEDIAEAKQGHMHTDGFKVILKQFPPCLDCVKPLCHRLRLILFPLTKEGELETGTPSEPARLYGSIVSAFDKALADDLLAS